MNLHDIANEVVDRLSDLQRLTIMGLYYDLSTKHDTYAIVRNMPDHLWLWEHQFNWNDEPDPVWTLVLSPSSDYWVTVGRRQTEFPEGKLYLNFYEAENPDWSSDSHSNPPPLVGHVDAQSYR